MVKLNSGRFVKGLVPWNKGLKGIHLSPGSEFKLGDLVDEKHPGWKGDEAGYAAKHQWIRRKYGKAGVCENCGVLGARKYEWANISGEYKRDRSDWLSLCVSCHRKRDGHGYKMWETRRKKSVTP